VRTGGDYFRVQGGHGKGALAAGGSCLHPETTCFYPALLPSRFSASSSPACGSGAADGEGKGDAACNRIDESYQEAEREGEGERDDAKEKMGERIWRRGTWICSRRWRRTRWSGGVGDDGGGLAATVFSFPNREQSRTSASTGDGEDAPSPNPLSL